VRTVTRLLAWSSTDAVFTTLFRERPDSYRAQWQKARMTANSGDLVAALNHYQATIALWSYARPVFIEAGSVATQAQQQRTARSIAEQALQHFPDDPVFLRRLAVAAINLSDTATARSAVARGLKVEPDDPLFNAMQASFGFPPTQ
jgi:predicted Zn-dependent protease